MQNEMKNEMKGMRYSKEQNKNLNNTKLNGQDDIYTPQYQSAS